MRFQTAKSSLRALAPVALAVCASSFISTGHAATIVSDWNQASGGNWSTAPWTPTPSGNSYPDSPGEGARIRDNIPSNWPSGVQNVNVDVTGINIDSLTIEDNVVPSAIGFNVNNSMSIGTLNSKSDSSTRNTLTVAANKVLTVNTLNFTGDYNSSIGGTGTIKFAPVNNAATFGYVGYSDNNRLDLNIDYSDPALATMTFTRNAGSTNLESLNATWTVGNTTGTQTWIATGGSGTPLTLQSRSNATFVAYVKPSANNVDMGARTGINASDGFRIARGNLDNPVNGSGNLFTTSAGGQSGGTATIADYFWQMTRDGVVGTHTGQFDRLGANLTLTSGGSLVLSDQGSNATFDDVNGFYVLPGNSVTTTGTGTNGRIRVLDTVAASSGRNGIYFAGATLNASSDLDVLGANTFLNDGGSTSTITSGGNVTVQSANPTGFATVTGSPVAANAFDDFNLAHTSLTTSGGGTKSFDWNVNAANKGLGVTIADFSQANFQLGTWNITNSTLVNYQPRQLYLDGNTTGGLNIALGSTLNFLGGDIYILDPTNTQYARLESYLYSRIIGADVRLVAGVGEVILVPEPASLLLLPVAGLLFARRRFV